MTKASFALLFAVGLVAFANVPGVTNAAVTDSSHHLIVGARVPSDYLLAQQVVLKSSRWLRVVTRDVSFTVPNYQIITQVKALDQKTNGNGAYASITNGGPGNRNVTVHFKSTRGHSINFVLEIYGH